MGGELGRDERTGRSVLACVRTVVMAYMCVRACVREGVRECVRACVRMFVRLHECMNACICLMRVCRLRVIM